MSEFARFGDPARFEIAVRWKGDAEPRSRRPGAYGWSMGDVSLTIGGQVITRSRRGAAPQSHVGWYLGPLFEWLAINWALLLHEEAFAWPEKSDAPAVIACHRALDLWIGSSDPNGRARYRAAQGWYRRHALRQAAEGGLFPDLFIRRLSDDIELSWSAAAPLFAPNDFEFVIEPGHARLPVADVASPLWEALQWSASVPPTLADEVDRQAWSELCHKIDGIRDLTVSDFDSAHVAPEVLDHVREALVRAGRPELANDAVAASRPYVEEFSPAVAMFGGVSPNLRSADIETLCAFLATRAGGSDGELLRRLVDAEDDGSIGVPYAEGYGYAELFLADLDLPDRADWVDIRGVARRLEIEIIEVQLQTDSIRGVALAGVGFRPTILINAASVFNLSENGKRFTIAHELCHVLHDRSRARRVAHISGQWVTPGVERRANAFAAYVLMPRDLVVRLFDEEAAEPESVIRLAQKLHVNETALIEHLYNLDLIDETRRERLRTQFRRA